MLYMYANMEEVQPYFDMFDKIYWKRSGQPTLNQLDSMCQHGVKGGPEASRSGSAYMQFFALPLLSFLIVVHLSHTSNCHSSIAPIYVVYVGC
jgi:hypothetical protein